MKGEKVEYERREEKRSELVGKEEVGSKVLLNY